MRATSQLKYFENLRYQTLKVGCGYRDCIRGKYRASNGQVTGVCRHSCHMAECQSDGTS